MLDGLTLADESIQVLVFVCLPLLGLLVFIVVSMVRSHRPSVANFPTFSVTINSVSWHQAYVLYREGDRLVEFDTYVSRNRMICTAPKNLPQEELQHLLPNLTQGLGKLRRSYVICRRREPQVIPAEEQNAAIAELRQMGAELQAPVGQGQVQRAVIHDWHASGTAAQGKILKVQELMQTAPGVREKVEVVAQSDD
jgi:hypothetical protein